MVCRHNKFDQADRIDTDSVCPACLEDTIDTQRLELDRLRAIEKSAQDLCDAVDNLNGLQGHDNVVLRKHLLPCSDLDFCVVSLVIKRARAVRAHLAARGPGKEPGR